MYTYLDYFDKISHILKYYVVSAQLISTFVLLMYLLETDIGLGNSASKTPTV